MKESVQAFEEIVKQMGTGESVLFVTLLDVLAEMAVNIEEQRSQLERITAQIDVLAKGGKLVGGNNNGGNSPFSIG